MQLRHGARRRAAAFLTVLAVGLVACADEPEVGAPEDFASSPTVPPVAPSPGPGSEPVEMSPTTDTSPTSVPNADAATTDEEPPALGATPAPAWLGTRVLEPDEDGRIPPQPTPPELIDRRIVTTDLLPPPEGETFVSAVSAVPDDVLERSTWSSGCPVSRDELRYLTVSFHGFDGELHTGELLVHADVAEDVVGAFREIHAARFPIEEMRVVSQEDLDAAPTGDGNNTTAFVCRAVRGATSWSEHAYGKAVDVNPFHNPYERRGIVLPELATAYTDRDHVRPGMLFADGPVVAAFAAAGWGWGGSWTSHTDPMHFSVSGR